MQRPEGRESWAGSRELPGVAGVELGGARPGAGSQGHAARGPWRLTICLGQVLALALMGDVSSFISAPFSFRAAFELGFSTWGKLGIVSQRSRWGV